MRERRQRILANIRASLAQTGEMLQAVGAHAVPEPHTHVHPPLADLVAQFSAELAQVGGNPHRCANDAEALTTIQRLLQEAQADAIIAWDRAHIGLTGLDELLDRLNVRVLDDQIAQTADRPARLATLEPARVCLSGADVGIAESGTIGVLSGAGRSRMASLLAPVHVAVLRTSSLVRGLGDALTRLQGMYGPNIFANHSNLTLITGPSRTADIELTLTIGVHGPGALHVVLLEEPPAD